jgi:hypothetical protein
LLKFLSLLLLELVQDENACPHKICTPTCPSQLRQLLQTNTILMLRDFILPPPSWLLISLSSC